MLHFPQLPADGDDILDGHVHHILFSSGDECRAETVRILCSHYPLASSGSIEQSSIRERHVEAGLKKILDKYSKFRKTSDPVELANFKMHCHETFSRVPLQLPVLVVPPQVNERIYVTVNV